MPEWEYRKIDLNQLPRKTSDIDVLCEAGRDGWELVATLPNNVAYLKRVSGDAHPAKMASNSGAGSDVQTNGYNDIVTAESAQKVQAKYRDPTTNETWSGRGRMALWLKRKQDAGEDIDDYLVQ